MAFIGHVKNGDGIGESALCGEIQERQRKTDVAKVNSWTINNNNIDTNFIKIPDDSKDWKINISFRPGT